jgi:SAM-dependent methyltransferase
VTPLPPRVERLKARHFDENDHPYQHLERAVERVLRAEDTIVEAGCGRTAPLLRRLQGRARRLIGIDLEEFTLDEDLEGVELVRGSIDDTGLPAGSVDLALSRALMEHLEHPRPAFAEIQRILRPGGRYIFLVPNLGDYGSIAAWLIPNSLHPGVVRAVEGRDVKDTFPAYFRCSTRGSIQNLCDSTGLELVSCDYLGQYPAYLQFNSVLFWLGTMYEKLISRFDALRYLRGWLLVEVRKPEA